jgi:dGTP triphosphohydrolase
MNERSANFDSEKSTVSLRQYLESSIAELSKRMDARFEAADKALAAALVTAEKAVAAALVSQDKLTSAAFVAAKEALAEAQTQLSAYKASANEWRGTLNDLISTVMVRKEVEALFVAVNTKIDNLARVQNMMIGGFLLMQVVIVIVLRFWK